MAKMLLYILLYAAFNVSGAAMIKWQLRGRRLATIQEWFSFLVNISFVAAFLLILLSALLLFKALSTHTFSLILPMATGINFILTVVVGYYFFQDKLSVLSFVGFVLIISGVFLLTLNHQSHA